MEDKKASGPFPGPPGPSFYSAASSPLLALSGVKYCLMGATAYPPSFDPRRHAGGRKPPP